MGEQGSYHVSTIAASTEIEINRLKAQVDLFWAKELKHYKEFGLSDGMRIVELGNGPGFMIEKLLQEFPQSTITGVEIDPMLVSYAREKFASTQYQRCEIKEGSIMATNLHEDTFDFAITRLVLEHLPDPVGAVGEVLRILKPGGKAVFVDNDFELHTIVHPHVAELREIYDAYCQARHAEGGNPRIGRELPIILKEGGFSQIDFEVIIVHSEIQGDDLFFKSEGMGIPVQLARDGFLSSKALGKAVIGWRDMVKNERHSMMRLLCMAVGKKPLEKGSH